MVLLTPLGLLAPGGAFGEDAPEDLDLGKYGLSAVPERAGRSTTGSGATRCSTATASADGDNAEPRLHPVGRHRASLVVGAGDLRRRRCSSHDPAGPARTASRATADAVPEPERRRRRGTAGHAPDWLLQPASVGLCPCGCIGKRKKGSFVEKTLTGGADLLRQVMFTEDVAAQRGLLQRIDPRVKLVGAGRPAGRRRRSCTTSRCCVAMYAGTLVLAAASGLPLGFFVKRVWLFIPIFTGIVVLPATLSIVTPGDIVLPLWNWYGTPQGLTAQGLTSAALVVEPGRDVDLARRAADADHAVDPAAGRAARARRARGCSSW